MTEAATTEKSKTSTLVVANPFEAADLRAISNYEDALRLLQDKGIDLRDAATEIGDGFIILDNKDELLDKPFVILHATFGAGDFGSEFCIMRVVSASGKYIVTDGGTGINAQLRAYVEEKGSATALVCQRGLRKSVYDTDASGQPTKDPNLFAGKGTTYYLNV